MLQRTSRTRQRSERFSKQRHHPEPRQENVGTFERVASIVAGGGLALFGLKRGSLVGMGLTALGGSLIYRGMTGHCPAYQKLGRNTATGHSGAIGVRARHGRRFEKTIDINRPPEELYRYWRNVENLPQVMGHLSSVRAVDDRRSHWVARGPWNQEVEWDAEIINERENELIAWRSIPGGDVDTAGSVHFQRQPDGRGTRVTISVKYDPPGGKMGDSIARFLGDGLEAQLDAGLHDFKRKMESGQLAVPTTRQLGPPPQGGT